MRTRQPFEDVPLEFETHPAWPHPHEVLAELPGAEAMQQPPGELGISLPLGFMPHRGENRRTRRAAVANWAPPKDSGGDPRALSSECGESGARPPPIPSRRELLKQRQRQRRGKLDIETRRLQRKATK